LKDNKFYSMIGLAVKAGKVVSGGDNVVDAVRGGKAKLVLLSEDASKPTIKRITDKCTSYGVDVIKCGSKQLFGKIASKNETAAIAVIDSNFANELKRIGKEIMGVCE